MGWLNDLTGWIDPLKDKIDPLDAYVQTSLLGNQDVQNKVLPTIGTTVLDYFYPGAGAALRASNDASEGNWTGAGINALAGMYGLSSSGGLLSGGADAASGASGGLSATESIPAMESIGATGNGISASGGLGSGLSTGGVGTFGGMENIGGLGTGLSAGAGTGAGVGAGNLAANSLGSGASYAGMSAAKGIGPAAKSMTSADMLNLANKGFKMYSNAQNEQRKQAQGGMPMISSPDIGGTGQRQFSQFGKMSPYQNMQGYNPRKYGYQFKRGLLEG